MALNFLNDGYFAGKVGIGVTVPVNKIQANYTPVAIASLTASVGTSSTNWNRNAFLMGTGASVSNALAFGVSGTANDRKAWIQSGHPDSAANSLGTISLNPLGGDVGIGTTSPGAKLDVQGTQGQLFSVTDNLSGEIFAVADISGVPIMTINSSGVSYFDGKVGIGTQSPNAPLEVRASAASPFAALRLSASSTKWWQLNTVFNNTNPDLFFAPNGGTATVTFQQDGDVGIGTTNPSARLDIVGNGSDHALEVRNTSTGDGIKIFTADATANNGLLWFQGSRVLVNFYSSSSNYGVLEMNDATANTVKINSGGSSFLNGGNVGIGVTNPTFGLTLSRNSDPSGLNSGVLLALESSDLALSSGYRMKSEDASSNAQYYQVLFNGDNIQWKNWTGSAYAAKMTLSTAGALRLNAYGAGYLKSDGSGNITAAGASQVGPFLPLAGGTMTGTGSISMPDNFSLLLGNGILKIFNDGSNSIIRSQGEPLFIDSNGITFRGYSPYNTLATITSSGVSIKSALLSNQENTDVDTGTETIAEVAIATYTAAFFDFVVKKTTNVRSGTVYACHDGTNPQFTETSTQDLGDTSDVVLSVDISGGQMRLRATVASDNWSIKSLIRAI